MILPPGGMRWWLLFDLPTDRYAVLATIKNRQSTLIWSRDDMVG
jgi:hypothetical protein